MNKNNKKTKDIVSRCCATIQTVINEYNEDFKHIMSAGNVTKELETEKAINIGKREALLDVEAYLIKEYKKSVAYV